MSLSRFVTAHWHQNLNGVVPTNPKQVGRRLILLQTFRRSVPLPRACHSWSGKPGARPSSICNLVTAFGAMLEFRRRPRSRQASFDRGIPVRVLKRTSVPMGCPFYLLNLGALKNHVTRQNYTGVCLSRRCDVSRNSCYTTLKSTPTRAHCHVTLRHV